VSDFDPIAYAEQETAHLTDGQVADVQAFLVGIFASYVDDPAPIRVTAARWRRYVRDAVAQVRPAKQ
jgi:hypothetical protein